MPTVDDIRTGAGGEHLSPPEPPAGPDQPRAVRQRRGAADRLFRGGVTGAGVLVMLLLGLIAVFLLGRSLLALRRVGVADFLTEQRWLPETGAFGIAAALPGTILIACVALAVAFPVAFTAAVYIAEYAPAWLRRPLIALIDLMAAIPSIVYALWGFFFLQGRIISVSRWMADHLGFVPFFRVDTAHDQPASFTSSMFIAGFTVSLMIIPVCCALMREVFSQAPTGEREAAYALGSTRWGMVRSVVLPFARGGIVGATMLGLGRALGETIVIAKILNLSFHSTVQVLSGGGSSITATIAQRYKESGAGGLSALMAAGLALFLITLVVNALAAVVVNRSRSGQATEV